MGKNLPEAPYRCMPVSISLKLQGTGEQVSKFTLLQAICTATLRHMSDQTNLG